MQIASLIRRTPQGILVTVLFALPRIAAAQGAPEGEPSDKTFFKSAWVDFWGNRKASTARKNVASLPGQEESIWAEPILQPDGRVSLYVPPKAVLEFMEHPSKESGRKYLAWQAKRMKKLKAAIEILRTLKEEREKRISETPIKDIPPTPLPEAVPPLPGALPSFSTELLYFKRDDCPYCQKQDKVLAALGKTLPSLTVRTLKPEDAPELWKAYGISVVPSIVIPAPGRKPLMLRGFMPTGDLIRVIKEINREER